MKMFKKLMAVALAGVMALVVLTGCASNAYNTKEVLDIITDGNPIKVGPLSVTLKATGEEDAAKVMKVYQKYMETKDAKIDDMWEATVENIDAALEVAKTTDTILVSCVKLETYQSKTMQKEKYAALANSLLQGKSIRYRHVNRASNLTGELDGTASLKVDNIGEDTYAVLVVRIPAKK